MVVHKEHVLECSATNTLTHIYSISTNTCIHKSEKTSCINNEIKFNLREMWKQQSCLLRARVGLIKREQCRAAPLEGVRLRVGSVAQRRLKACACAWAVSRSADWRRALARGQCRAAPHEGVGLRVGSVAQRRLKACACAWAVSRSASWRRALARGQSRTAPLQFLYLCLVLNGWQFIKLRFLNVHDFCVYFFCFFFGILVWFWLGKCMIFCACNC